MNKDLLFKEFPFIQSEELTLKKIEKADVNELHAIYSNENLYKYKPGNAKKNLSATENMISHFERDFNKKKIIFLGIYVNTTPQKLVGVAEMFDADPSVSNITIGYTLNEEYFGKGIATKTVKLMVDYLFDAIDVNRIQAYVMPENTKSQNVLTRNKFIKEGTIRQAHIWTGRGIVDLELYSLLKSDVINS